MKLHIDTPCQADWNEMSGDHRVKFCDHCQKNVHDVSAMTVAEASALVEAGNSVCVRFYRDASGEVMTAESGSKVFLERRTFAKLTIAGLVSILLPLRGQDRPSDTSGLLTGQVVDSNGAKVPQAKIQLKSGAKAVRELESDSAGNFRIQEKPGSYTLVVLKDGWRPAEQILSLETGSELKAKIVLQLEEPITMGALAPPIPVVPSKIPDKLQ